MSREKVRELNLNPNSDKVYVLDTRSRHRDIFVDGERPYCKDEFVIADHKIFPGKPPESFDFKDECILDD